VAVTYPGIYAVPGSIQPGGMWAGETLTGATLTGIFLGNVKLTYSQYINLLTGSTLTAVPGQSYPLAILEVVNGHVPIPPSDGAWEVQEN
jgi:hypothetical protein